MENQIEKIKALAVKNYEIDGGDMLETFSSQDYADLIAEHGTAAKAWAWHMRILSARREAGGYYEAF